MDNEQVKQAIRGHLLGDSGLGCLDRIYPSFGMTQALEHIDWLQLTQTIFLSGGIDTKVGSNAEGCYLWTPQCRELVEFRAESYPDGTTRKVSRGIELTPTTVLFWYVDDGSLSWSRGKSAQVNFATHSFSKMESAILGLKLSGVIPRLRFSVRPSGKHFRLNILGGNEVLKGFFNYIDIPELIPASYLYKFRGFLECARSLSKDDILNNKGNHHKGCVNTGRRYSEVYVDRDDTIDKEVHNAGMRQ